MTALYLAVAGPVLLRIIPAFPRITLSPAPPMPFTLTGDRLASAQDAIEVRRLTAEDFAISTPRTLAAKIPSWLALSAIVSLALLGAALPAATKITIKRA